MDQTNGSRASFSVAAGQKGLATRPRQRPAVSLNHAPANSPPLSSCWPLRRGERQPPTIHKLFRDHLTGAAKLGGEVLQLWKPISHGQHGLCVIHVNSRG